MIIPCVIEEYLFLSLHLQIHHSKRGLKTVFPKLVRLPEICYRKDTKSVDFSNTSQAHFSWIVLNGGTVGGEVIGLHYFTVGEEMGLPMFYTWSMLLGVDNVLLYR